MCTRPKTSFWLPTSTDRFYPDLVALFLDGRKFAVKYTDADRFDTADAKEKTIIGQLWADMSKRKGVFLVAQMQDEHGCCLNAQIDAALA